MISAITEHHPLLGNVGVVYDENKTYVAFKWSKETLQQSIAKATKELIIRQMNRTKLHG
jgi:hypothetical protein